jgi:hypothetical protein
LAVLLLAAAGGIPLGVGAAYLSLCLYDGGSLDGLW